MSKDPFEELFGRPVQQEAAEETTATEAAAQTSPAQNTQHPVVEPTPEQQTSVLPQDELPAPVSARRVTAAEAEARSRREFEETLTAQLAALAAQQQADAPAPQPAARAASGMGAATSDQTNPAPRKPQPVSRNANPEKQGSKALPWIIVAGVAVIAIAVASLVVGIVNSNRHAATQLASEQTNSQTKQQSKPSNSSSSAETKTGENDSAKQEETTQQTKQKDSDKATAEAPKVDVGQTMEMPIGPWNATSQLSQRFGMTYFNIPDGTNLYLSNDLLKSFPDSCATMREGWGASKQEDGTYKLLKPAGNCTAAPELYREIWGLLQAWVDTIKPAS